MTTELSLHQRTVIRRAVKAILQSDARLTARLKSGDIEGKDKIHASRYIPMNADNLPACSVYCPDEEVDPSSWQTSPLEYKRMPELHIIVYLRIGADENTDDALDAYARIIEKRIMADDSLGGTVSRCHLARTETENAPDASMNICAIRLSYHLEYFEFAPRTEDTSLDDFTNSTIDYNIEGNQEDDDAAVDKITLPT